jgi:hypothetical protein
MRNIPQYVAVLSLILCSSFPLHAQTWDSRDLTQFDYPLLVGDWYLLKTNSGIEQDFAAIRLTLSSSYTFTIQVQNRDDSIGYWEGKYSVDQNTITLGIQSLTPQSYSYVMTHNRLMLNGVIFYKAFSNTLVGYWQSQSLSGHEHGDVGVTKIELVLQPDFVFLIRSCDEQGNEVIHEGVYYTENNHLVFLYEQGEHDARFELDSDDQMILNLEDGAMLAVLTRVR